MENLFGEVRVSICPSVTHIESSESPHLSSKSCSESRGFDQRPTAGSTKHRPKPWEYNSYTGAPLQQSTSKTSIMAEQVLQINREAIAAMINGNNKQACSMLTDALQVLEANPLTVAASDSTGIVPTSGIKELLPTSSAPSAPPASCCAEPTEPASSTILPVVPEQPSSGRRLRLTTPLPMKDRQETLTTAIYNRAFLLHKGAQNNSLTAAVLLFNQGLSCHLLGMSTADSQQLRSALYHYNQAYHVVLQASYILQNAIPSALRQEQSNTRLVVLLAAALCHNMAAVHGDFWNFAEARLLRCQLAQVIQWEGSRFSQMETDDFVFFHLGIFFAIIDDFRIAPAA
jgi:hypothetical protein